MDGRTGPVAGKVGQDATVVQFGCDFTFGLSMLQKSSINPADVLNLVVGARYKCDPIRLQALMLTALQFRFDQTALVQKDASQAIASRAALPIPQFDQAALPGEHLC